MRPEPDVHDTSLIPVRGELLLSFPKIRSCKR
jgi:hypothetical protein